MDQQLPNLLGPLSKLRMLGHPRIELGCGISTQAMESREVDLLFDLHVGIERCDEEQEFLHDRSSPIFVELGVQLPA